MNDKPKDARHMTAAEYAEARALAIREPDQIVTVPKDAKNVRDMTKAEYAAAKAALARG